jgi:hypothetical protein
VLTRASRRLQLFNPDNALFVQSAEGVALQPNPHSHVNADHLSYLHFAGRLIGIGLLVLPRALSLSLCVCVCVCVRAIIYSPHTYACTCNTGVMTRA